MSAFRPGLSLARDFSRDVVRGLVDRPHAACLLGKGADVLGLRPAAVDRLRVGATAAGLCRKRGHRLGHVGHRARSSGAVRRMAGALLCAGGWHGPAPRRGHHTRLLAGQPASSRSANSVVVDGRSVVRDATAALGAGHRWRSLAQRPRRSDEGVGSARSVPCWMRCLRPAITPRARRRWSPSWR